MKKSPLIPRTFRLDPEDLATLNAMPNRNDWIRGVISNALKQRKTA